MYSTGQVLQHLLVPRDIECLCPYTPKEIGGDGSYDPDPEFLSEIIRRKSRSPAETLYRMERQLMRTWAHKYVVSDKPRGGVFKHDLILPTLDRLRKWLPDRAVIVPPSEEHAELLQALPRGILESPTITFFKIVKRVYYHWLFRGILLPNLMVRSDVESKRGSTKEATLWRFFDQERMESYLERWRNPGFSYRDNEPYFVVPYRHKDILSLSWNWKFRPERPTETSRIDITSFLDVIMHGKDVPLIVDRLNMYFETDPLLMIRVRENSSITGTIGLVSGDKKLARRIVEFIRANRDRNSRVVLIHPSIFFLGRIQEVQTNFNLFDAGAINYFGRTVGRTNLQDVDCAGLKSQSEVKYPGVSSVWPDGIVSRPVRRKNEIRTEGPDLGYIEDLVVSNQTAVKQFIEWQMSATPEEEARKWNESRSGFFSSLVRNQEPSRAIAPPSGPPSPAAGADDRREDLPPYTPI
jgi:hypothetical protein